MAELVDSYVKLLLPFDGVDGAQADIDHSGQNHILTFVGNAQLDTAQKKFGASSCLFDGTGDWLVVPKSSDTDFLGGDFTIDFWLRLTDDAPRYFFFGYESDWHLGLDFGYPVGGRIARTVGIYASSNGTSWDLITADSGAGGGSGTIQLVKETWYHIAFTRSGDFWRTFIDGVKDIELEVAGAITDCTGEDFRIGRHGSAGSMMLNGHLDEFRISKGIARWTANFTPPPYPYHKIAKAQVN